MIAFKLRLSFLSRLGGLALLAALSLPAALRADLTLVSRAAPVADSGQGASFFPTPPGAVVSADGRYAVFLSRATNLVSGQVDTLATTDVFLRDLLSGRTALVSHAAGSSATAANGESSYAVISADGNWVAFASLGVNLVAGQTDLAGTSDVFLYNTTTGAITLVSHAAANAALAADQPSGAGGALALSADGRYLAFASDARALIAGQVDPSITPDVFLYDRLAGTTTLVSHAASDPSTAAGGGDLAMSADGRFVAFASAAANLVAGQVDAGGTDLFLFDRTTGGSALVSHAAGAPLTAAGAVSKLPVVSADGAFVAFVSAADNLVAGQSDPAGNAWDVFLWERATGATLLASRSAAAAATSGNATALPARPAVSADGRFVAFESNAINLVVGQVDWTDGQATNGDLFLFDRVAGTTALVSRVPGSTTTAANRSSGAASISADGAFVAFASLSPVLVPGPTEGFDDVDSDVFLFERATGFLSLVSPAAHPGFQAGAGASFAPTISADGRFVAFTSQAPDLVSADANGTDDVFLYSRSSRVNTLVSVHAPDLASATAAGASQTSPGVSPTLSADGRFLAFLSSSTALFPGQQDANGLTDLFVADRLSGAVSLISQDQATGRAGSGISDSPSISADGRRFAFRSNGTDLADQIDTPGTDDVFLYLSPGHTELVSRTASSVLPTMVAGNGAAAFPFLSADGTSVAFASAATDLVAGVSDDNGLGDVFLYDWTSRRQGLVSHAAASETTAGSSASSAPISSADGSFVAYLSLASDLVAGTADANGTTDVILYERATRRNFLVSHHAGSAAAGNGASNLLLGLSAEGRFVLHGGTATDLVAGQSDANGAQDLFLYDRTTGTNALVSHAATSATVSGNAGSFGGALSADGRYAAFLSTATNLVAGQADMPGTRDLFLYDRLTGMTELISRAAGSAATAAGDASDPAISADGRFLAFASNAANLVAGQVTPVPGNVFLYDRQTGATRLVSRSLGAATQGGNGVSSGPVVSADGRSVAFTSLASDLVAGDRNGAADVFLDRATPATGRFFTVAPCRFFDTRLLGDHGVPLFSDEPWIFPLHAACGIPSTAQAVSLNLTVVAPTSDGFLSFYPGDQASTAVSTINFRAGQVRANNAVARLALDGSGTLAAVARLATGASSVHLVIDVNGYFE